MRYSTDLAKVSETFTAEDLVDANTDFVKGVIYKCDLEEGKYVTPTDTFNGRAWDCYVLTRHGNVFQRKWETPIPVRKSQLGEIVGVIIP